MNAEVISIGDEITSGQRLDTNSQWLSQQLEDHGARVDFHTTVGDRLDANVLVFRQAIARADVVVATGGLGPTADDLTREALARATGKPLRMDEEALTHIRALFARRRRDMPERNVVQAMFPEGGRVIENPHGTAPGIDLTAARAGGATCRLFALPGVPAEMREMFARTVAPALRELHGAGRRVVRHHCVKCFGVGESELEQMLPDMIRRGRVPTVGITASKATMTLRLTAEAESEEACQDLFRPTLATMRRTLGRLIFSEDEREELQHVVLRLLRERGQTLATAEVGSQGTLAAWLSLADDRGATYRGGFLIPAHEVAAVAGDESALHDRPDAERAAVSATFWRSRFRHAGDWSATVREYAREVRALLQADFGLVVGRFPQSDAADRAPGDVHIGVAAPARAESWAFPFAGHPELLRERAVKQALNTLRLLLQTTT